mgnify:CR=1 FL=1
MRPELMTHLGLTEHQAKAAIASLPSNVLGDILDFIHKVGPHAKAAIIRALPFLLKGDTWGAIKAVILYFVGLIPAEAAPEPKLTSGEKATGPDVPPITDPPEPKAEDKPEPAKADAHSHHRGHKR